MTLLYSILVFAGLLVALTAALIVAERYMLHYGAARIDVNAGERPLTVEGGQSLLSALVAAEIYIPAACGGKGTCGYCKVTIDAGAGPVGLTERPFLTRAEIRRGVRLACQVKVRGDMAIRIPDEILDVRLHEAEVVAATDLTHDIREIRLRLDDAEAFDAKPGQYVQVQAPTGEGPVSRAYSISSTSYGGPELELIVRRVPGGVGSMYLHGLRPGDRVSFTGPYGQWRMSEDPDIELVCIAGGVGMAPMKGIINGCLSRWPDRACWLFFGCRTLRDVFYLDHFRELAARHPNFRVVYALSEASPDDPAWSGDTGHIHLAVDRRLDDNPARQVFLCGPPPMIEAVTAVLRAKGVSDEDIFFDEF